MIYYILLFIIFFLLVLINPNNKLKNNYLPFIFIAFLVGFRSLDTRIDTRHYYDYYTSLFPNISFSDLGTDIEIGYAYYNLLSSNLGLSFSLSQFLFFLVPMLLSIKTIKMLNCWVNIYLYLLYCFLFFWFLQVFRQSVSILYFVYALSFLLDDSKPLWKRNIYYIVIIWICSLIHISILVTMPFILVNYITLKKKLIVILIILSIVLGIFFDEIVMVAEFLNMGYIGYIERFEGTKIINIIISYIPDLLMFCFVVVKIKNIDKRIINMYTIAICSLFLTCNIPLSIRAVLFSLILIPLLLSSIAEKIGNKNIFKFAIILYGFIKFAYNYMILDPIQDSYSIMNIF